MIARFKKWRERRREIDETKTRLWAAERDRTLFDEAIGECNTDIGRLICKERLIETEGEIEELETKLARLQGKTK